MYNYVLHVYTHRRYGRAINKSKQTKVVYDGGGGGGGIEDHVGALMVLAAYITTAIEQNSDSENRKSFRLLDIHLPFGTFKRYEIKCVGAQWTQSAIFVCTFVCARALSRCFLLCSLFFLSALRVRSKLMDFSLLFLSVLFAYFVLCYFVFALSPSLSLFSLVYLSCLPLCLMMCIPNPCI